MYHHFAIVIGLGQVAWAALLGFQNIVRDAQRQAQLHDPNPADVWTEMRQRRPGVVRHVVPSERAADQKYPCAEQLLLKQRYDHHLNMAMYAWAVRPLECQAQNQRCEHL